WPLPTIPLNKYLILPKFFLDPKGNTLISWGWFQPRVPKWNPGCSDGRLPPTMGSRTLSSIRLSHAECCGILKPQ
ncbi:MAG: hypothetical protein KC592_05495, partial [Nitrospira sp.]|nr:hypothetical protein [Nitrospira sp.]